MLRIATVVIGAKVMPIPAPATIAGTRKLIHVESGPATKVSDPKPTAKTKMPTIKMYLPPMRSAVLPAKGATTIEVSDIGASVRPAVRAEKPRTDCR